MRTGFLSLILLFTFSAACLAQSSGYKLQFKVDGLKDTTAYLGYYYGESTFVKDTARVNHTGEFFFEGKQTLPQGVYFLVLNKTRIFEFVVSQNQHFTLATNTADYIGHMKVTGDIDNKLFFENMRFNMDRRRAHGIP